MISFLNIICSFTSLTYSLLNFSSLRVPSGILDCLLSGIPDYYSGTVCTKSPVQKQPISQEHLCMVMAILASELLHRAFWSDRMIGIKFTKVSVHIRRSLARKIPIRMIWQLEAASEKLKYSLEWHQHHGARAPVSKWLHGEWHGQLVADLFDTFITSVEAIGDIKVLLRASTEFTTVDAPPQAVCPVIDLWVAISQEWTTCRCPEVWRECSDRTYCTAVLSSATVPMD